MACNWNRKDPCCHVRFCPLVPAWATTIHKFQGFEAGHDDDDRFKYLLIDPGNKYWEQMHPGSLYVALSRGKTLSNIYWIGDGMCINRIQDGAFKQDGTLCELFKKRKNWVEYLRNKQVQTANTLMTLDNMTIINDQVLSITYTSDVILRKISTIIKNPQWHRTSKHKVHQCFFD